MVALAAIPLTAAVAAVVMVLVAVVVLLAVLELLAAIHLKQVVVRREVEEEPVLMLRARLVARAAASSSRSDAVNEDYRPDAERTAAGKGSFR